MADVQTTLTIMHAQWNVLEETTSSGAELPNQSTIFRLRDTKHAA